MDMLMHQLWTAWIKRPTTPGLHIATATYATEHGAKIKNAPPQSVINFRNMQRRRGGAFSKNVRVDRKSRHGSEDQLRQHMFETSQIIKELSKAKENAMKLFKDAESMLHERMQAWRALARSMRARRVLDGHPTPQLGAPAWNQVMLLAIHAESPTAAWHIFCDMKKEGIRPTPRTYAGFFQALTRMIRARKLKTISSDVWEERMDKMYLGLTQLHKMMRDEKLPDTDIVSTSNAPVVDKDISSLATAYRMYISLQYAVGRYESAMKVFDTVCPDPYRTGTLLEEHDHLLRSHFATVETYTSMVRDLGMCHSMPMSLRQQKIRQIWRRWQDEIVLTKRRHKSQEWLDATAIKTLVWTLSIGNPATHVRDVCALLGTYMGIPFPPTQGMTDFVPVSKPVRFTDPRLLVDVMVFFDKRKMYRHAICCFNFAEQDKHRSVDPQSIPEALTLKQRAHKCLMT